MYSFELPSFEFDEESEYERLLALKRMLPRWLNSVPDFQFLRLFQLADSALGVNHKGDVDTVLVETGTGASSLALFWAAAKHGRLLFTWDTNGSKLSHVRQVIEESMSNVFGSVNNFWRPIPWTSTSDHLGIQVLSEMGKRVALSFHDSDHTWATLGAEVEAVTSNLLPGALLTIDDANLDWESENLGLVSTFRQRLGFEALSPEVVESQHGSKIHSERVEEFLSNEGIKFQRLRPRTGLSPSSEVDPYHEYFRSAFQEQAKLGTEVANDSLNRFAAYRLGE